MINKEIVCAHEIDRFDRRLALFALAKKVLPDFVLLTFFLISTLPLLLLFNYLASSLLFLLFFFFVSFLLNLLPLLNFVVLLEEVVEVVQGGLLHNEGPKVLQVLNLVMHLLFDFTYELLVMVVYLVIIPISCFVFNQLTIAITGLGQHGSRHCQSMNVTTIRHIHIVRNVQLLLTRSLNHDSLLAVIEATEFVAWDLKVDDTAQLSCLLERQDNAVFDPSDRPL